MTGLLVGQGVRFGGARVVGQQARLAALVGLALFMLALAPVIGAVAGAEVAIAWLVGGVAPGWGGLWWLARKLPRGGSDVEVRPEGLFAEGALVAPRESIKRALLRQGPRSPLVTLQLTSGLYVGVEVCSEVQGRALVEALGLDAGSTTSDMLVDADIAARLQPSRLTVALSVGAFLTLGLTPLFAPMWVIPIHFFVVYYLFLLFAAPRRLVLGLDGLLFKGFVGKRLVRLADVDHLERVVGGVDVVLTSGRKLPVRIGWTAGSVAGRGREFENAQAYGDALHRRLDEVLARSKAGGAGLDLARLGRDDLSSDAWLARLKGLLSTEARGFREAPVIAEQLWVEVENAQAEPSSRAAAAVALSSHVDIAGKERLRVAAKVAVSEELKSALEAAAADDETAMAEALDALDRERLSRRA